MKIYFHRDHRDRIIEDFINTGRSYKHIARTWHISESHVYSLVNSYMTYKADLNRIALKEKITFGSKQEPYFESEEEYFDRIYYFSKKDFENTMTVDPELLDSNYKNFIDVKRNR